MTAGLHAAQQVPICWLHFDFSTMLPLAFALGSYEQAASPTILAIARDLFCSRASSGFRPRMLGL